MAETPGEESEANTAKEKPLDEPSAAPTRHLRWLLAVAASGLIVMIGAAVYASPNFNISLPNFDSLAELHFSSLAELFSHETASAPIPDPVIVALKDIQSAQQQHATALQQNAAALQENGAVLQQSTVVLKQDAASLELLRQGSAVQQADLKRISNQLSLLVARVDALQNAVGPLTTSSISPPTSRSRAPVTPRKKILRPIKPAGPVSVGGAPLSHFPPPGWGAG